VRVLTWNLYHGRSQPAARGSLAAEFAGRIAGWDWDIALLQEVPPWWTSRLAREAGGDGRTALTSRNARLPLRRQVADRRPELLKSNGGGANAILLRRHPVARDSAILLRRWPERRVAQIVRLGSGVLVVNVHLSTPGGRAADPRARARDELARLWRLALADAGAGPLVLGGDLNLFDPEPPAGSWAAAGHAVDHVLARGCGAVVATSMPDRRASTTDGRAVRLSDHEPLIVELRPDAR
jgi:endonuclease/exonuclease/phosphatase family metal-dependent hydrolase